MDPDDNNNGILTIDEDSDGNGDLENYDLDTDGIPDYLDDHVLPLVNCEDPISLRAEPGLCEASVAPALPLVTDNFRICIAGQ